jgi:hypothetical protein
MFHFEAWTSTIQTIRGVCVENRERWLQQMETTYRKRWHLPKARITVTPLSDRWLSDYDTESIKRCADR